MAIVATNKNEMKHLKYNTYSDKKKRPSNVNFTQIEINFSVSHIFLMVFKTFMSGIFLLFHFFYNNL